MAEQWGGEPGPDAASCSLTLLSSLTPQLPIRNGSEVRDPLVTYEGSNPPASPLQGDLNQ